MPNKPQPPDIPTSGDDSSLSAGIPDSISEGNAMENSSEFRRALNDAWGKTASASSRNQHEEHGFSVYRSGKTGDYKSKTSPQDRAGAELEQTVTPDTTAILHTHPTGDTTSPKPSDADIAAAKKARVPVMIASKDGLYEIDATGGVHQTSTDTSFKPKPSGQFKNASYSMAKDKPKKS
jgi:hypothetical protein